MACPSVKQCSTARDAARGCARNMARKSACASRWCRKSGFCCAFRKAKLQLECPPLFGRRREIPEIVEPAFTGCDDHGIGELLARAAPRRSPAGLSHGAGGRPPSRAGAGDAAGRAQWPGPCRPACCRSRSSPTTPAARARSSTASRSALKLSCARLAPMSTRGVTGRRPGSSGAERRRHRQARGPQRRQESADHADHDAR